MHELTIKASNFQFQAHHFDVPAGVTDLRYSSSEGSHTTAFANPDLAYVSLSAPAGRNTVKVDFVEGRIYAIYYTIPGHRSAGLEATITVGPRDSEALTVTTTIPAPAIGR